MSAPGKFRRGVARVRAIRELVKGVLGRFAKQEVVSLILAADFEDLREAWSICDELIAESAAPAADTVPPPADGNDELEDLRAARAGIRREAKRVLDGDVWAPGCIAFVNAVDHYMAAEERLESRTRQTIREATETEELDS